VKRPIISFFKGARPLFFCRILSQKKKQTRKEQKEEKLHAFKKTMDDEK